MDLEEVEVQCPYCGEMIYVELDGSAGQTQRFISDCDVCCRPIEFVARFDEEGEFSLEAKRDSDT